MWWQVVFWILLVPLLVIEFILFLKTRKYSWLIYALAIFTYVIAITYIIDVFELGKNAVILILLASSGLMIILGRRLRAEAPKETKGKLIASAAIGAVMLLIFVVSVLFGKLSETVQPAQNIQQDVIATKYDERGNPVKPVAVGQVTILNRTFQNSFIMPVPVPQQRYKICLKTTGGTYDLYEEQYPDQNLEVKPGETKSVPVRVTAVTVNRQEQPSAVLVYKTGSKQLYMPCVSMADSTPEYTIPVV